MRRVVIIDSAIDYTHVSLKNSNIIQYEMNRNGGWEIVRDVDCKTGHGTAIANILSSTINDAVEIINFIVFDQNLKTTELIIISALKYIYDNIRCSIINMSLGSKR